MFSKRATVACLALAIAWAAAGRSLAADVLDAIPNTALAVVVVNRLEATSDKIEKLATKVQAPSVSLLSLARVQTGIHEGLDDKATAAMAWLPSEDHSLESPIPIVVLPVSDYAKFVAQLQPENAKDNITQVYVAGKPVLVCQRGDFAVLASVDNEPTLKDVLASVKSVGADLSPLRTWLTEVDVAAVATPTVIKMIGNLASDRLSMQIAMFEQQGIGGVNLPALKLVQKVMTAAGDELQLAAIGFRADEAGTVRVTTRLRLTPGGSWATTADRVTGPAKPLLAGLPEGPFVLTAGFQYSEPVRNLMDWLFSEEGRKLNPALEKLPADLRAKWADIIGRLMAEQENLKLWVGATKPGEPLLSNTVAIAKVEDAKKYFALFEEFNQLQLGAEKEVLPTGVTEIRHLQVDGLEVLEVTGSLKQMQTVQSSPVGAPLMAAMAKIFGSDDKYLTYMAAVDDHTVVTAYVSLDNLRRAIAVAKAGADSGGKLEPQAAEVAEILPTGAQMVALVQLSRLTESVQSLVMAAQGAKGPTIEFPASPPIGLALKISSAGVLGETIIPGPTLEAIGQAVANQRNKR